MATIGNLDIELPKEYGWVATDDPVFRRTLRRLLDPQGGNMTIMGSGGCGKSVLLQLACTMLDGRKMVLGSTGIAACNIAGKGIPASTIHSGLKIRPSDWLDPSDIKPWTVQTLKSVDVLLIDEVSMITSNMMDYILSALARSNRVRRKAARKPTRLLLFGDVMQLPPVVGDDEAIGQLYERNYEGKRYFFSCSRYQDMDKTTQCLYQVYRQADDGFVQALQSIRMGEPTPQALDMVNSRVMGVRQLYEQHPKMMYLAATNSTVGALNAAYERRFESSESLSYEAAYDGEASGRDFPTVPQSARLSVGQQVMTLANTESYQNGTIARIQGFSEGLPVIALADGSTTVVQPYTWDRYRYSVKDDVLTAQKVGSVTQIACKSAYATTFHKSQGLTLDSAYMDFRGWCAPCSVYLGLSRVRTLEGIGLKAPIRRQDVATPEEARSFLLGQELADEQLDLF